MRKEFAKLILELAEQEPNVYVLSGDIGFGVFQKDTPAGLFRDKFPERFINIGINEQAMISVAAGMAIEGPIRPVVYTITPFLIERPWEQVKIDIDQQKAPVMLVGYADYPGQGPTHAELDGEKLMGMLKNTKCYFPKNNQETREAVFDAYKHNGPTFISLKKAPASDNQ